MYKCSSLSDVSCLLAESHKLGLHYLANGHSSEVVMVREKRLIDTFAVKSGMLRFNFMIESCHPGSVPDAHLIAALLHLVTMCLRYFFSDADWCWQIDSAEHEFFFCEMLA